MKKILKRTFILLAVMAAMVSCTESDTENAIEDVGENIERAADDAKEGMEDVADDIKDATN